MMHDTPVSAGAGQVRVWPAILAACCASIVGIGLARFAYSPLIPVLINEGWLGASAAAYLGAANLAGYLAGALLGRAMAARSPTVHVLRTMMLLASATFFACALPWSFWWFLPWRFASGFAGGVLMVLAAPTVLLNVPADRRGLAGGAIFAGVGLGVIASGTLVPLMLDAGLTATWCGLGMLALVLTLAGWRGWPPSQVKPANVAPRAAIARAGRFKPLYFVYALNAVGLVPHMVFLVDYIARGLGRGVAIGSYFWIIFGIGAVFGPMLAGHIGDRIGFGRALRLALVIQAAALLLVFAQWHAIGLVVSTLVMGAFTPGIVPIVLGRVQELLPDDAEARAAAWSIATTAFAIGQAAAAYGFSALYARTGSYDLLFWMGAGAFLLALLIERFMMPERKPAS